MIIGKSNLHFALVCFCTCFESCFLNAMCMRTVRRKIDRCINVPHVSVLVPLFTIWVQNAATW